MRGESERPEARPDRLVVLFAGRAAVNSHWESAVWCGWVAWVRVVDASRGRRSSALRIGSGPASAMHRLMRPMGERVGTLERWHPGEVPLGCGAGGGGTWGRDFRQRRLGRVPVRTGAAKWRTKDGGENSNPRLCDGGLLGTDGCVRFDGSKTGGRLGVWNSYLSSSCLGWASWRWWYWCRPWWPSMTQAAIGVN